MLTSAHEMILKVNSYDKIKYLKKYHLFVACICKNKIASNNYWGEPERAPH